MEEEQRQQSFVDTMSDDEDPLAPVHDDTSADAAPVDSGGKAPDGSAPTTVAGADPRVDDLVKSVETLRNEVFTAKQETAYYRGEAAAARRTEPKAETPAPYKPDLDYLKAEMEKGPEQAAAAIAKMAGEIADSKAKSSANEVEGRVDGKLTQSQRRSQLESQLKTEGEEVRKEYGELMTSDPSFDSQAFDYAQDLARRAGMPELSPEVCAQMNVPAGSRAIGPGMMRAAADAVYGRFAKAGKLKPKSEAEPASRSLKEVVNNISSDKLGSNGAARNGKSNGTPKTLEDMKGINYFKSDKEVQATRNLCKRNGWDEGRWVANTLAAIRNGEIDVN